MGLKRLLLTTSPLLLGHETHKQYEGRFTLWPSKSRGHGIEWPNFVEGPKKWAKIIKNLYELEPSVGHSVKLPKVKPKVQSEKEHPALFLAQNNPSNLTAMILLVFQTFAEIKRQRLDHSLDSQRKWWLSCSLSSPIGGPPIMFTVESRMVIIFRVCSPISYKHMPSWYLSLKPKLTICHPNFGVQYKISNKIRDVYLNQLILIYEQAICTRWLATPNWGWSCFHHDFWNSCEYLIYYQGEDSHAH
jgi:hypothetical protein